MKERGGLGVAGLLLLMFTCGGSETHGLERPIENTYNSYSSDKNFGSRATRDAASNFGRPGGLEAGGGVPGAWSARGVRSQTGSASGQGDISKHLVIDVSSADGAAADQVRPASPPAETVLGFETSGDQVPEQGAARPLGAQAALGSGRQAAHGTAGHGAAASPAAQLGREDISIEVDTGPRGAPSVSAGQTAGQSSGRAAARQLGRLSGQQRSAKSPRQLSRPSMTGLGARAGDASIRDSISVSAEIADDQPSGSGSNRVGQKLGAAVIPTSSGSSGPHTQWPPEAIPGQAGVDYPTLSRLPQPEFDCHGQDVDGFYADTTDEAKCQAFWVCHNDQKDGFLCPNGTVFNQRYFSCDWWFNVRCQESPLFYQLNRNIAVVGTRLNSRPGAIPPSSSETDLHPVLTLLQDMLEYPRVPPVLPHSSQEGGSDSLPIHSAVQPALPSRNQYSDDAFHAPDRSSVHVAGGIPGIPPPEGRAGDQRSKVTSHEAISSFMKLSEGRRGITKRHVKRHVKRTPKKHYYRSAKGHRGSAHLRERKVRGYDLVHEAEEVESAASALSAKLPQMEQSAMSQVRKRTPGPSSGAAFTSVQEGAMSNLQQKLQAGRSGPLLQTVDKVAFPMDVKSMDFPKVEEDFNVQETSGIRKSTSIKSVLPSHLDIPQPGAVNVIAASGNQQNADAYSGGKNVVGNQNYITGVSDKQDTGVPGNFAGISLTEDVQLDKDVHDQDPGAVADTESVSGSSGQANGVSLVEDVEFDEKSSVPAPSSPVAPQAKTEPKSTSVMESLAGDNGQGHPGVSVQENVQVDQKREVSGSGLNQPPQTMSQSSGDNAGGSNGGANSNGPGVSVTGNVQVERPAGTSNQGQLAAPQSPSTSAGGPSGNRGPGVSMTEDVDVKRQNTSPVSSEEAARNPMSGGIAQTPGLSLTENVQIGHNGNSPSNGPMQKTQPTSGDSGGIGGQPMTGDMGSSGGSGPANSGNSGDQMNVDAFLADQTGARTPPPAPPPAGPAIRSEESVHVDFDEKPQNQQQGDMLSNLPQTGNNQPSGPPANSPEDAASKGESTEQQPPAGSNPDPGPSLDQRHRDDSENGIKISPKAEQVLEEQSNVKILIPYDKDGTGFVPSGQAAVDDQMGDFGIGSQVNSGIALGNAGSHNTPQDSRMGQLQDQPLRRQAQSPGQSQDLLPNQPQEQLQNQPQQAQNRPQTPQQGQFPNQLQGQLRIQQQGQRLQANTADSFSGFSAPGPGNAYNKPASSPPGKGKEDVKIAEDVSVHREPSGGLGSLSGVPSAGAPRPGYLHAGDAHMNASAMTIPKKDGSSKILEELDAKSQFASNVGDEPGTVKTHVQTMEEKLGDQPGTSDLLDDPSALKREMPSENVKALQQQTPPPQPQGEIIPGRQNVQITSESVSRIIKNPARHRSVVKDPSGLDLPELLRPPGFGTNYSPFKAYPTMRTVKPVSPATPQPSVARLAGSIDMKSNNNAAGPSPSTKTLTAGVSEKQTVVNNGGAGGVSPTSGLQRTERGDLSTKLSDTLKMVDNILGPPPFKSKRNLQPKLQQAAYLNTMENGHPSSLTGRGQKRASDGDLQDGNMGINLTVLINEQADGQTSGQTGAAVAASAGPQTQPAASGDSPPAVMEKEKIKIFDSLKDMARKKPKGATHKKHKLKQTAEETEIKDVIEVKSSGDDDDSETTYDYDISELPSWMKKAVRKHVKSSHNHS